MLVIFLKECAVKKHIVMLRGPLEGCHYLSIWKWLKHGLQIIGLAKSCKP